LGPRLFAAFIYGWKVFQVNNYYFWITIIGPILGSLTGVRIFQGYTILMKNYAYLSDAGHVKTTNESDQGEARQQSLPFDTRATTESNRFFA
jgi:hypothetical protein